MIAGAAPCRPLILVPPRCRLAPAADTAFRVPNGRESAANGDKADGGTRTPDPFITSERRGTFPAAADRTQPQKTAAHASFTGECAASPLRAADESGAAPVPPAVRVREGAR